MEDKSKLNLLWIRAVVHAHNNRLFFYNETKKGDSMLIACAMSSVRVRWFVCSTWGSFGIEQYGTNAFARPTNGTICNPQRILFQMSFFTFPLFVRFDLWMMWRKLSSEMLDLNEGWKKRGSLTGGGDDDDNNFRRILRLNWIWNLYNETNRTMEWIQ